MTRITIRAVLLATLTLAGDFRVASVPSPVWTAIAVDPKGDGHLPASVDVAQLSYQYDRPNDTLWFRLALFNRSTFESVTVDVAIDSNVGGSRRTPAWRTDTTFAFDRVLHVRISRSTDDYRASAEISEVTGSASSTPSTPVEVAVRVDQEAILIGCQRATMLGPSMKMSLVAAVGSNGTVNDEIPNVGSVGVDLDAARPVRGLREIDVSRDNLRLGPDQAILSETAFPQITERGHGPRTLILIPGVYSGADAFTGFMARNASAYTFYVFTPPGLNGTPARPLPPQGTSVGEFTWTRRLARDIRDLITRKHLDEPILVAHGFPGDLAAEELAATAPHLLGGVIEIAGMAPQFFPAPNDPRRLATPAERIAVVNESWMPLFYRYVTPQTWETNNYPAEMFANDSELAERVRLQVESAALPVKIRYLVENMATDRRGNLERLDVPVLALIPGFSESILANPLFSWFKTSFQTGWEPLPQSGRLETMTLSASRALMLDDQPALADKAIASFVERQSRVTSTGAGDDFIIKGARVFDGSRVLPRADVWVRNGHIEQVGSRIATSTGTRVIDGTGHTVLPGLIDAHVHTWPTTLHEALVFGVTTVLDMFSDIRYAAQIKSEQASGGALELADLRTAGILVTAPKGHGTQFGMPIPTIVSPDEAQAFVDARIAEGSDYIKLVYDDGHTYGLNVPTLSKEVLMAVITAAHARGKLAVVHIGSLQGANDAVSAGADGLAHLFVDRLPDAEFVDLVASHRVFVVPTLSVLAAIAQVPAGQIVATDPRLRPYLTSAAVTNLGRMYPRKSGEFAVPQETVRQLKNRHVPILAGSDAPNPGTASGASLHGELELLVQSGLTPVEALASATSVTAAAFRLPDRGRIASGLRADLVLVKGDPTRDITTTRNIVSVWKRGVACDRKTSSSTLE